MNFSACLQLLEFSADVLELRLASQIREVRLLRLLPESCDVVRLDFTLYSGKWANCLFGKITFEGVSGGFGQRGKHFKKIFLSKISYCCKNVNSLLSQKGNLIGKVDPGITFGFM